MSDAAPARVTLVQRPKSHVLDSRSLPGQEHTGQKHVAQVISPGEVFAVSVSQLNCGTHRRHEQTCTPCCLAISLVHSLFCSVCQTLVHP